MNKHEEAITKLNIYDVFGRDNDGIHGFDFDRNIYELQENVDFFEAIKPLVGELEVEYKKECEECIKRWRFKPPLKEIYIRVKSDEDFDNLKKDEKVIQYCDGDMIKIHLIHGSWFSYYDLYDEKSYELDFDYEPGNVDDAATYLYVTCKEISNP